MNDRPITYVTGGREPFTPAHFLLLIHVSVSVSAFRIRIENGTSLIKLGLFLSSVSVSGYISSGKASALNRSVRHFIRMQMAYGRDLAKLGDEQILT